MIVLQSLSTPVVQQALTRPRWRRLAAQALIVSAGCGPSLGDVIDSRPGLIPGTSCRCSQVNARSLNLVCRPVINAFLQSDGGWAATTECDGPECCLWEPQ